MASFVDNFRNTLEDLKATQAATKTNLEQNFRETVKNGDIKSGMNFINNLRNMKDTAVTKTPIVTRDGRSFVDANKVLQPMSSDGRPMALSNGVANRVGIDYEDENGNKRSGAIWVPSAYADSLSSGQDVMELPIYGFEQYDGSYMPYSDFVNYWNSKKLRKFGLNGEYSAENSGRSSLLKNPNLQKTVDNYILLRNPGGEDQIREKTNTKTPRKA